MIGGLRPQDQGKAIGLVAGILFVFVFAGWRISSMTGGAPAPTPAQGQPVALTPTDGAPTTVAMNTRADNDEIELPTLFASASADPFRTVVSAPVQQVAPPVRNPGGRVRIRPEDPILGMRRGLPPVRPFGNGDLQIQKDPSEEISVRGVVTGAQGVAVMKVGDQEVVARIGDTVGDGYTLESVGSARVVLKKGRHHVNLSVGTTLPPK